MRKLLVLWAVLLMGGPLFAESIEPGSHARTYVSPVDGAEQPYNLFVPTAHAEGEALPLVVALHGYGATWETWFEALDVEEWAEEEGYYVLTPEGRGNWFYLGKGEDDLFDSMEDVKKLVNVDEDRMYLIGHSMGGWGTWHTACAHPDVFAAIVAMSGWADAALLGNLEYSPPLVIHGRDDEIVDVWNSRKAVASLSYKGISHRYIEVRGAGHESSVINDHLPVIGEWLRGRLREKAPPEIAHSCHTPTRGKSWWLSIREIKPEMDELVPANVHARWDGDAGLKVNTENVRTLALDFSRPPLNAHQGTLAVRIDNQDFELESDGWAELALVFTRETLAGEEAWTASLKRAEELTKVESPVIGKVMTPPEELMAKIGAIVTENGKRGSLLLTPNLFLPEKPSVGSDLTLDDILDIYTRPDDNVEQMTLTAEMLNGLLKHQEEWRPEWWGEAALYPEPDFSKERETFTIMVPEPLWEKLKQHISELKKVPGPNPRIRTLIYQHVLKTGEL